MFQAFDPAQAKIDRWNVGNVGGGPYRMHAWLRQARAGVDAAQPSVREIRAHDAHVQLLRKRNVGGEPATPHQQRRVLEPHHRPADEFRFRFWLLQPHRVSIRSCARRSVRAVQRWRISRGGRAHGLDDILVAGAAAEIGGQHIDQIVVADVGLALQHAGHQHQKAGRAEAALQAVIFHEGALQRIQFVAVGKAFDGADLFALGLHREHQTRAHRIAVDQHRAGAADTVLAADMRAGLTAILADGIGQRAARLDAHGVRLAVDVQRDVVLLAHEFLFPACRNAARMRCGVAGISLMAAPNGASASLIALRIAAGGPMAPPSPSPFDCVSVAPLSVSRCSSSIVRNLVAGRRQKIRQRRREDVSGLVVHDLFQQRVADALRDAAHDLAVHDHRIDETAGIFGDDEPLDRHASGVRIDLDDGGMAGIGKCAGRIVGRGFGKSGIDLALEQMGLVVGGAREASRSAWCGRCRRRARRRLRA